MPSKDPQRATEGGVDCPRILIVEDDDDQRALIQEALCIHYNDPTGRNIVGVRTAAECLAQNLQSFDVLLQDYNLPDMDGLELLGKVLTRADLPVIIVTSENISATAATAIQAGAQDYLVKLGDYLFTIPVLVDKNTRQHQIRKDNERLQRELQSMLSKLRIKNIQLQESLEKLQMMATTDHLTGLANRRRFGEILERYYSEAMRYGFDLTCCMCDLDNYKHLNDALGHQVGDELLVITADVIRSSLRSTDVAARYGGDEFVLLLPHTSVEQGLDVGERIRHELLLASRSSNKVGGPVTLSVGVASLAADRPSTADALVALADRALYIAKDQGKDRIVVFHRAKAKAPAKT